MRFTQHIVFYADTDDDVLELVRSAGGAEGPGFLGGRVLRFRDKPGRYVIQADFESLEAAEANNDRRETQEWASRLGEVARSEIKWENLDVLEEM